MGQFADLHCHPHLRSFNYLRNSRFEKNAELRQKYFNPWHIIWSNPRPENKGNRASAYSSGDLVKLSRGGVKLVFASLYPMEKGWFKGRNEISQQDLSGLLRIFSRIKVARPAIKSDKAKALILKAGDDKGSGFGLRDILQTIYMKIPIFRINFIQGHSYDYFKELNHERDFLLSRNNQFTESNLYIPFFKRTFLGKKKLYGDSNFCVSGTYKIAKNAGDVLNIIDQNKTAIILTIEGANVFNSNEDANSIKSKISAVKNWTTSVSINGGMQEEELPVFFIGFAHHFYNFLCGHAHSIPDIGKIFIDQTQGMDSGFTDKGKEIIRYILSLDDNNRKDTSKYGRRILIDVKHMSAMARKWYYTGVVEDCRNKDDHIPVIASHCGYSGIKKLDDLIDFAHKESDNDAEVTIAKPFNTWNINLCDEDILNIWRSGGIIGINLDQRVLGIPKKNRHRKYPENFDISVFWRNLKSMMSVVLLSIDPDPEKINTIHNLFCLGSDYDGYIDPLDKYATALKFDNFRNDLIEEIENDPQRLSFFHIYNTQDFVDGICYDNAFYFVQRHFK